MLRCTWGQKKTRKKQRKIKKTLNKRQRTNRNTFENRTADDPLSSQEKKQKDRRTDRRTDGRTVAVARAPLGRHLSLLILYKRDSLFLKNADRVFHTASNTVIDRLLLEDSGAGSQFVQPEGRREPAAQQYLPPPALLPFPSLMCQPIQRRAAAFKASLVPSPWVAAAAASVSGVLDPVADHPLLAGAPLDHQPQAEVGLFGHLHLQAAAGIAADDRTVLPEKKESGSVAKTQNQTCVVHPTHRFIFLSVSAGHRQRLSMTSYLLHP